MANGDGKEGFLTITKIEAAARDQNRCNIFINGRYRFSLTLAQVVELKLKTGKIIDTDELARYEEAGREGKLYQQTLEWALTRPRSVGETREYLERKRRLRELVAKKQKGENSNYELEQAEIGQAEKSVGRKLEQIWQDDKEKIQEKRGNKKRKVGEPFSAATGERVLAKLVEKGYVDDEKFASWFAENRESRKGTSRRKLQMEMRQKGLAEDLIEQALNKSGRDERAEIGKIIAKKGAKMDKTKLSQYLMRRGFDLELVREVLDGRD